MLPIPRRLLQQGVRDMVRISDARMSGTAYGACVLHVSPESFVGGPLAFVQDGDLIELDVQARKLELHVSDDELDQRRAKWIPDPSRYKRGFGALYAAHVTQADQGCDFDLLQAGADTPEPEIPVVGVCRKELSRCLHEAVSQDAGFIDRYGSSLCRSAMFIDRNLRSTMARFRGAE